MIVKHVGIVVADIAQYLANNVIGTATPVVYDATQDADICFISSQDGVMAVELIQPRSRQSRVYQFLHARGGGLHHLCYGAETLAEVERVIEDKKMIRAFGPVIAPALGGTQVLFAYTLNKELVEFEIG